MKLHTDLIWLPRRLHKEIRLLASRTYPNETGGVLVGFDAGNGLVVTAVVGPGPQATHKHDGLVPDYDFHDAEIKRLYVESGRLHTYLGDWHSHPDGPAMLSTRDKRTLKAIAAYREARAPIPIMGILAGARRRSELTVWRLIPRKLKAGRLFNRYVQMQVIESTSEHSAKPTWIAQ
jgi:integrative and conjugative element protein (TIGR02256 family)